MKNIICSLAVILSAVAFGEKLIKSGETLVFMGDSITQYGQERSHGYPNLVVKGLAANKIDVIWHGVGVCGETSRDMLGRFDKAVISKNPDVVTISAGVNDVWFSGVSYDEFRENERKMVQKTLDAKAKVVLLSPTTALGENDNSDIRKFSAAVRSLASEKGLGYAPAFEMIRAWIDDPDTPVTSLFDGMSDLRATYDGVHQIPAGDRQLARATLKGLGLDADELSKAEAAWNADDTLVPLPSYMGADAKVSVELTAAEAQVVKDLSLKQILDRGIPSLAANPTLETEADGATVTETVSSSTGRFTYKAYDQLLIAARKLGIRADQAIKCAVLRGARDSKALDPTAPDVRLNGVMCGSDAVTFDVTISSVGATASACDALLRYGTSAGKLDRTRRIAVGENGSFTTRVTGFSPSKTYFYELTFENNATTPRKVILNGSFATVAASGALKPSGSFDDEAIQAALDAAASTKGTVALEAGVFTLGAELTVPGGVRFVGHGWEKTTLHQTAGVRVVTVSDGSAVEGMTIEGGKTLANWQHGAGALIKGGTLSHCRVRRNFGGYSGSNVYGGGVNIEKGTIDHTIVCDNKVSGATCAGGGICWRYAGGPVVIDTCLICNNTCLKGEGGGIAIVMGNPDLTIRNTTIAGNHAKKSGGGLFLDSGVKKATLLNTIVACNTSDDATADLSGTPASASSNNFIGGAPQFANAETGDYHLSSASPAIDAGKWYSGIADDLDGNVRGEKPAIGCYEQTKAGPKRSRAVLTVD